MRTWTSRTSLLRTIGAEAESLLTIAGSDSRRRCPAKTSKQHQQNRFLRLFEVQKLGLLMRQKVHTLEHYISVSVSALYW
jgi:hypothetical protein